MNLTFLNGAFLFAALAALLPLLIHLISRRRVATVDFSSLRFLKELERKRIRRVRLRQILLLVVRSLILLFAALALARPTLRGALGTGGSHAKTSAAIVLDTSASMARTGDGDDLMGASAADAAAIAALLEEGDQAFVVTAGRPVMSLLEGGTFSPDVVAEVVGGAGASFSSTDYRRAVEVASALLADARNLNRELYLLGDMQASGWTSSASAAAEEAAGAAVSARSVDAAGPGEFKVYLVPRRGPEANLSVDSVEVERRYGGVGGLYSVTARVSSHGRRGGEILVRLFVDDEQVAQAGVEVEERGSATARFVMSVDDEQWHACRVELPDDAFAPDNRRHFVVPAASRVEVLVIRPGDAAVAGDAGLDDADYIERALDPTGGGERFSLRTTDSGALAGQDRDRFPVVVLADAGRLDDGAQRWLVEHVEGGGGLLVVLGNRTDVRSWNQGALCEAFGIEVRAPFERAAGVRLAPSGQGHQLLEGLVSGERLIDDVEVRRGFSVPRPGAEEILELPGIGPALTVGRAFPGRERGGRSAGEVAVLSVGVDASWSDLPRSGLIVPLLHRLVDRLSHASATPSSVTVGDDLEVGVPASSGGRVSVATPDDSVVAAELGSRGTGRGGGTAVLRDAAVPGVYRFSREGRLLAMGAVNVDAAESDLEPMEPEAVSTLLRPRDVVVVEPGAGLAEQVLQSRYGRELWRAFVYAALALIALEMYLARPRYS